MEIRDRIKGTSFYTVVRPIHGVFQLVRYWVGRDSVPPSYLKQRLVRTVGRRYNIRTLIETGTFKGDMVAAAVPTYDRIFSIELDPGLARAARKRFLHDDRVTVLEGDSTEELPKLLNMISDACVFWLDAHYSGGETALGQEETPIGSELETILSHPYRRHVLLIDDAREFLGTRGYPTLNAITEEVRKAWPHHAITVKDDIIRIHPVGPSGGPEPVHTL